MSDALSIVFGILGSLMFPVAIGLAVYGIIVWRRRAAGQGQDAEEDAEQDAGIGTVRRLYFYLVAFVSLMMFVSGVALLLQFVFDSIFGGDVISESNIRLAGGASLAIVGLPLWFFHWRFIQRAVAEQPVEIRSILRKLYIYITLAVAVSILIYATLGVLNWIFGVDDFSGYGIAAIICWSAVWAFHWLIEEREGQPTPETRAVRRLYIYIAALVALVMLSLGVGRALYFVLLEGYNALASVPTLAGESGLWRPTMREMLSVAIFGGGAWALHWLYIARQDYGSALRQVYLYIFAILGGVMTTLSALGIIIHEILVWALGNMSAESNALHFGFLPGSVATLSVGAALWAYHWHMVRRESDASAGGALSARRAYTYILSAIGTGALAVAIFMLVSAAFKLLLASFSDVVIGGELWKGALANIVTLGVLGGPVWGYYWRTIQGRTLDLGADERESVSRRIFIFAALGVGVLALLGSVSALLFMFLRDLLDAALSLDTLNDMSAPVAIIAAAAAFLPYYWSVYREDRDAAPEAAPMPPVHAEAAEVRPRRKEVTLLAAGDGEPLARRLQGALGYEISTLRWADADAATPALTDEACAELAQAVAVAEGGRVMLIPDGDGVRVVSYD